MAREFPSHPPELDPTVEHDASSGSRTLSATQLFFLARLSRFLELRRHLIEQPSPNRMLLALLDRAIFSTYRDCIRLGVAPEARRQMDQQRGSQSSN